jgi:hypothetical protein
MAVDLLLDAAADLIDRPAGESDHMKSVEWILRLVRATVPLVGEPVFR